MINEEVKTSDIDKLMKGSLLEVIKDKSNLTYVFKSLYFVIQRIKSLFFAFKDLQITHRKLSRTLQEFNLLNSLTRIKKQILLILYSYNKHVKSLRRQVEENNQPLAKIY